MEKWLADIRQTMAGRILAFNFRTALTWGELTGV